MPWSNIDAALVFWKAAPATPPWMPHPTGAVPYEMGFINEVYVRGRLEYLYNNSNTMKTYLDNYVALGKSVRIGENDILAGPGNASRTNVPGYDDYITINLTRIDNLYYFNDKGSLVKEEVDITLAHELLHIIAKTSDTLPGGTPALENGPSWDFDGGTLRAQKKIVQELSNNDSRFSDNIQISYDHTVSYGSIVFSELTSIHPIGTSFSSGNSVNITRIGSDGVDNLDMSNRSDKSSDLLFGLGGGDTLRGGGGNDYLYGGDGQDKLYGGDGEDFLVGGKGDDKLYGGSAAGVSDGFDDTADYTGTSISNAHLNFKGNGKWIIKTGTQLGEDELYDIQKVKSNAKILNLHATGGITEIDSIKIQYASSEGNIIGNFSKMDGVEISIDTNRLGRAVDSNTFSGITLISYDDNPVSGSDGTANIITGDKDDKISYLSDDKKIIDVANGNDIVIVGDGNAVIFGGEGADQITGGDGDDIIIDQHQVSLDELSSYTYSVQSSTYNIEGRIDGGGGNDTIIVQFADVPLAYEYFEFEPTNSATLAAYDRKENYSYIVNPGEGDDDVTLSLTSHTVQYNYAEGDGDDVVHLNSSSNVAYTDLYHMTSGLVSQASIELNLFDYSLSDISLTFAFNAVEMVRENLPNMDLPPIFLFNGNVTVDLSDGGSILLENVYWYVEGPMGLEYGQAPTEGTLTIDGGVTIDLQINAGFDQFDWGEYTATFTQAGARSALRGGGGSTNSVEGGGEVILTSGVHDYEGSLGELDRLIVVWDLDTVNASYAGSTLTISDKWGLLGTTTVTDFDEIYDVAEDRTYTPEEFADEMALRVNNGPIYGTLGVDTLTGTVARDRIYGQDDDDTLYGLTGDDYLDGGLGADTLEGGEGNDTYIVDDEDDVVVEGSDAGDDLVKSSINFLLAANVERLELTDLATDGTGNSGDNRLTGNDLANLLDGGDGDDVLDGRAGTDELVGGDGADRLLGGDGDDDLEGGDGDDLLIGGAGSDTARYAGSSTDYAIASLTARVVSIEAVSLGVDDGSDTLQDVEFAHFAGDNVTIQIAPIVVAGTEDADILAGTSLRDGLYGLGGNDTLTGAEGDDILDGGDGSDDLTGGEGDDTIDGGDGSYDTAYFSGDIGDYEVVRHASGHVTVTAIGLADDGVDDLVNVEWIYFNGDDESIYVESLPIAGLVLTGTTGDDELVGDAGNDIISGGDGNDTLVGADADDELNGDDGDDILDGGIGRNVLDGGIGTDMARYSGSSTEYLVYADPYGSLYVEGNDTYDELMDIEEIYFEGDEETVAVSTLPPIGTSGNDILTGSARGDWLYGLDGDDDLSGLAGNDYLDGGDGADTMAGGEGDDYFFVDDAGDVVTELSDEGFDYVEASISYTLAANVEGLSLWNFSVAINGTGNALDNEIYGDFKENVLSGLAGDDYLHGGDGNDTLIGGAGADTMAGGYDSDTFVLDLQAGSTDDFIEDFTTDQDKFALALTEFAGLAGQSPGTMNAALFRYGASATTASHRIIFDNSTDTVYYDEDGVGGNAQIVIANLVDVVSISASSFVII